VLFPDKPSCIFSCFLLRLLIELEIIFHLEKLAECESSHLILTIVSFSFTEHLKQRLEEYIVRFNGLVKLFRNYRREGLIRARSIGAKKASGQVGVQLLA